MKLLTVGDYRRAARARLSPMAWRYFRSGADAEETLRENVRAWSRWQIWPRVLVDVAERDLSTTVLGAPSSMPVLVAPTAYHKLAHADGELGTVRAAASAGVIACMATLATTSLEACAEATSAPKWFQLYVHRDMGLTRAIIARAEAAGYRALAVTVDTPLLGRRLGDERHGFQLPPELDMPNLATSLPPTVDRASALAHYFAERHAASFDWRALGELRASTKLPIVLKGVMRGDDAKRAVDHGCAAIVVSNHGGRQLDGVPATIDALPEVVGGRRRARRSARRRRRTLGDRRAQGAGARRARGAARAADPVGARRRRRSGRARGARDRARRIVAGDGADGLPNSARNRPQPRASAPDDATIAAAWPSCAARTAASSSTSRRRRPIAAPRCGGRLEPGAAPATIWDDDDPTERRPPDYFEQLARQRR